MTTTSDIEIATDFVALAIDPAIPYTKAISLIADRVAEIRVSASPSVVPHLPGAGRSKNPLQVHESLEREEFKIKEPTP